MYECDVIVVVVVGFAGVNELCHPTPTIMCSTVFVAYLQESTSCEHDLNVFRMKCMCTECLKYRETLIQLVLEDRDYNMLWDRLKTLIREFYDVVPL